MYVLTSKEKGDERLYEYSVAVLKEKYPKFLRTIIEWLIYCIESNNLQFKSSKNKKEINKKQIIKCHKDKQRIILELIANLENTKVSFKRQRNCSRV